MNAWFSGLILGLALIVPIGPQNLFVLNQGLLVGLPRALVAVVAVGVCDTFLVVLGAGGAAGLLQAVPRLRDFMILVGVAFLVVLGLKSLLSRPDNLGTEESQNSAAGLAVKAAGVSLLNPHAVLDTVGVIGGAIAAQAAYARVPFAVGTISASYLWFLVLAVFASALRPVLTGPRASVWIQRGSGLLMLLFASMLASELF